MTRVAVGLGSNLGDRIEYLREAVAGLAGLGDIVETSPLYETAPIGGPDQPRFLNAIVVISTTLAPLDLLDGLQRLEATAHRERSEHWGPRTLDLDVVAWDEAPMSSPTLQVPHPRARTRRFVLAPLVDVWPDAPVGDGMTAVSALARVKDQPVRRWEGDWTSSNPHLGSHAMRWVVAQFVAFAVWGVVLVATAERATAGWRWWLGGTMTTAAVVLGTTAVLALGRELTPYPQPRAGAQLVVAGPYRLARHPIYGAIILGLAGIAVFFGSIWAGLVVVGIALFFRAKSAIEERALTIGVRGYGDYLTHARWRFLPFVW